MIKLNQVISKVDDWQVSYNLSIEHGQKVAIVGESGSGKTTLLNIIAGFLPITQGELFIDGVNHTNTNPSSRPVSLIFQNNNLFPHLTVEQNINLAFGKITGLTSHQQQLVNVKLHFFSLYEVRNNLPNQISGGQAQRAAIARSLLLTRPVLLMDEPFSALDLNNRIKSQVYLDNLVTEKSLTLLLVTHHLNEIKDLMDSVIYIKDGMIEKIETINKQNHNNDQLA